MTEAPARSLPGRIERIAIVRANNIGDAVLAVPALRAVRRAYPDAEITLIGLPKVRPLVDRLAHLVDRFAEFPGFPGVRERDIDPAATLGFLGWAQRQRFDLALQLHGNGVWTNPFTALLGARFSAGFVRDGDSPHFLGLDAAVVWPRDEHEIRRVLRLPAAIGIRPAGLELELPTWPADAEEVDRALDAAGVEPGRPIVAVHPAGRFVEPWPQPAPRPRRTERAPSPASTQAGTSRDASVS